MKNKICGQKIGKKYIYLNNNNNNNNNNNKISYTYIKLK